MSIKTKYTLIATAIGAIISFTAYANIYKAEDENGNVLLTNVADSASEVAREGGRVVIVETQTISSAGQQNAEQNQRKYYGTETNTTSNTPTNGGYNAYNAAAPRPSIPVSSDYTPNPNAPGNINYNLNYIENTNSAAFAQFARKFKQGAPIRIAHFGDSHVQNGWQIGPARAILQAAHAGGNGGRGIIFPYAIAKTYSQEDYKSRFTGSWKTANSIHQPPKIGVGVSGFVAKTTDNTATFGFDFTKNTPIGDVVATVYYRATGDFVLTANNGNARASQTAPATDKLGAVRFNLPNTYESLNFSVDKKSDGEFELHGVDLKNPRAPNGLIYHNLGVGGANFSAILQQKQFDNQFDALDADLVILDWGTNDVLYTDKIDDKFAQKVRQTIAKIRAHNPNVVIVLKSAQSARYKGKDLTATEQLSTLLRQIAKSENVLFYDWYHIAGGQGSVNAWRQAGFASKDTIHLNSKGYRIEGQMWAHALLAAINAVQ